MIWNTRKVKYTLHRYVSVTNDVRKLVYKIAGQTNLKQFENSKSFYMEE